jgi:hypothetical protein
MRTATTGQKQAPGSEVRLAGPARRGMPRGTTPNMSFADSGSKGPLIVSLIAVIKMTIPPATRKSFIVMPRYIMTLLPATTKIMVVRNEVRRESLRCLFLVFESRVEVNLR